MRKSLAEYGGAVVKCWWTMLIGITATIIGLGLDFGETTGIVLLQVPTWFARTLWIVGLIVALLVGPFWAFHRVRLERDKAKARLENRPTLWIRRKGVAIDPSNPGPVAWYYEVNIANPSPEKALGIRSALLEIKHEHSSHTLKSVVGKVFEGKIKDAPLGDIPNTFYLQPGQAISGYLVFEGGVGDYDSAQIILVDSQDNEHRFVTIAEVLTNR